jgi:hypothetical protein
MSKMNTPGFTAEVSLYKQAEFYHSKAKQTDHYSRFMVLPQLQTVRCAISGNNICCGVEDDVRGVSFSLGCGRMR